MHRWRYPSLSIHGKSLSECFYDICWSSQNTLPCDHLLDHILWSGYCGYCVNQPCLQDRRIHDMLTLIYRALNGNTPVYIKNLLNERDTSYNLRGQHLLNVPRVNTTNYGLHSFRYSACKLWNSLPNSFRTAPTTNAFKLAVNQIKFNSHHRRTGSFGLGGPVTLLPEKNCEMPESMCCTNAFKSQ